MFLSSQRLVMAQFLMSVNQSSAETKLATTSSLATAMPRLPKRAWAGGTQFFLGFGAVSRFSGGLPSCQK
jgi:hypothetical protein